MKSPVLALTWEIWRRGRRPATWALACLALCALTNLAMPQRVRLSETGPAALDPLFGFLMTVSLLLLFGAFNYTEFNPTKEWNGFPYRLFSLPLRTWQLVSVPMILGVVAVEVSYLAWIKLVLSHEKIVMPEWFALLLGAYMVFYQTALWCLAGFRILRIIALSLGGVSSILFACLPFSIGAGSAIWSSERILIYAMSAIVVVAYATACAAVEHQRHGGGQRRNWTKALMEWIGDALPRRNRPFASAAAAQFWFEWRRAGLILPLCTAFAVVAIFGPFSWAFRNDPKVTVDTLLKIAGTPIVLAFAIGKGFIKPEFWSTNLALPAFLGVRPLPAGDFVVSKMKVAALSVAVAWLLVIGYVALWLPLWADKTQFNQLLLEFRMFYPHSWLAITVLYLAGFMVLTWRCMVSGLWIGLTGKREYFVASICIQVLGPTLIGLAIGFSSDAIDLAMQKNPDAVISVALTLIGWILAAAVIVKMWFAVFSWAKNKRRQTAHYLLIWLCATACFVVLAIISRPWPDFYRLEHLYVLVAFLIFPLARLGLAPLAFAKNRHR